MTFFSFDASGYITKTFHQYSRELFEQESLKSPSERFESWIQDTLSKLSTVYNKDFSDSEYQIPAISNVIYLSHSSASKLGSFEERKIIATTNKLHEADPNFSHNFWTNNPNIVPDSIKSLPNLKIRDVSELKEHKLWKNYEEIMELSKIKPGYLAKASDILRLIEQDEIGGIYHDADYEIFDPSIIIKCMKEYTYLNAKEFEWDDSFIGNAFMASRPGSKIISSKIDIVHRNLNSDDTPEYIQNPSSAAIGILFDTGPVAITIAIEKFLQSNEEAEPYIILPSQSLYNYNMARAFSPEKKYDDFKGTYEECADFYGTEVCTSGGDPFGGSWANKLTGDYIPEAPVYIA